MLLNKLNELIKQIFGTEKEDELVAKLSKLINLQDWDLYCNSSAPTEEYKLIFALISTILDLERQLEKKDATLIYYHEQLTNLRKAMTSLAHDIDTFNLDADSNTNDDEYIYDDELPF